MNTPATEDEYHTMDELYAYRMAYHAHSAQGWMLAGVPVVKSWKHSDGEPCFGGGWFIVSAQLATGQVTNHYKAEHWDLFNVPAVDLPPAYDGHTPADALDRLLRSVDYSANSPATEDEREVDPQIKAIADAWLTHQGYRLDEIKDPDHSLCEMIAGVGWDCTDEEGRDRHPEYTALYQASEMANVALEALAQAGFRLRPIPSVDDVTTHDREVAAKVLREMGSTDLGDIHA